MTAHEADALSLVFSAIICGVSAAAAIFSLKSFLRKPLYFVLLGAFTGAMLFTVLADNFATLWLGMSATTLATAFLVGFSGDRAALEAAWKYIVLCSVGLAIALLGILCLSHVTGDAGFSGYQTVRWADIAQAAPHTEPRFTRLALVFIVIGFAVKAGLVPLHAWLPDAHSKAPAPVSALLSGLLVTCALYAVFRALDVARALGQAPSIHTLLLCLGAISILFAGVLMLTQRDLKRLLAYSTIEHAGIVALALGFGGSLGSIAALLHAVGHAFVKPAAFFAAGLIQREYGTTKLAEVRGVLRKGACGWYALAALAALAGMPPFTLFVSEMLVVFAGIAAHAWLALGVGLFGMLLACIAMARIGLEMLAGTPPRAPHAPHETTQAGALEIAASAFALACGLLFAFVPWSLRHIP